MEVDVVIVGAGPAGSSVAKHASEKGLDVLVLERKEKVGVQSPCAGYISKLVSRYFSVKGCVQQEIREMRTYFPSGKVQTAGMKGWIVDRPRFDAALSLQAEESGARIISGARATGLLKKGGQVCGATYKRKGKDKEVKSKVVVGADGALSGVARWSGLPIQKAADMAVCPQYEMTNVKLDDPQVAETYFGAGYAPGAYAWIYPTGKNSAKVGLGVRMHLAKLRPAEYLEKFITAHPIAFEKLKDAKVAGKLTGLVPVGSPIERTYSDGVLLAGDAAGMTDAISGAGILSGIIAGRLAAGVIAEAANAGDTSEKTLSRYEIHWKKILYNRLQRSFRKRKIVDELYSSDSELEKAIPETWITFKEFWRS